MAKAKLPKKVGGVKVPGKLRREAKKALKLTGSGAVRDLAVAGLTLAAEQALRSMQGQPKRKASLATLDLGEVVRAAAAEGARRFLEGFEETTKAARPARPARPKAPAKAKAAANPRKPRARAPGASG